MYEDSVGIPMLMADPDIPAGFVCQEPVSLVDGFPTILDSTGVPRMAADAGLPGASLFDVIRGHTGPRTVFSEYHASGSVTGAFMVRRGRYKLIHYAGMPPQLFDLAADPWEANDLAGDPGFSGVLAACEADLRAIADPEAIDARARRDQRARIDAFGGREAVLARGTFGHSPVPRETPVYTA
jgi:choline-sulfatase